MWAEIIFSRDDLARAFEQVLPLTIQLGEPDAQHSLSLDNLSEVSLVADVGVRLICQAHIRWPVLGIEVPVSIRALTVVLLPEVGRSPEGDVLIFRMSVEHADFSGLPTLIDSGITNAINAKLSGKDAELSWNFTKTLTFSFGLPEMLEPLSCFAAKPAWGKVRISEEAIVYAASFHSAFVRHGEEIPKDIAPIPSKSEPPPPPAPVPIVVAPASLPARPPLPPLAARDVASVGVFGLAAGFGYFALRAALGSRKRR